MKAIEKSLLQSLQIAVTSKDVSMTNSLSRFIKLHSRDAVVKQEVTTLQNSIKEIVTAPVANSSYKVWDGKTSEAATKKKSLVPQGVVAVVADPEESEIEIQDLINQTPQEMLDLFGTINKVRSYAKKLGLPIDHQLEHMEFLNEFTKQAGEIAESIVGSDL